MPVRIVSTRDSQAITVNAMVSNPLVIPEYILSELDNQFVMDQVLRYAGRPTGGAVQFRVSSGRYADNPSEIVPELGEIPLATITRGDIQTKPTEKRALGVAISQEMIDRDNVGEVQRQIQAVHNTMVRDVDGGFVQTLRNAVTQTRAATAPWSGGTATIRRDINAARRIIRTSTVGPGSYTGFNPDTIIVSPVGEENLLNSMEFQQMIYGSVNPSNVASLADVPMVLRLTPLVTVGVNDNEAFVLQSNVVGGYADERPLQATELYEYRPTETWRSDASRITVGFIDQPAACVRITGI